MIFLNLKVNKEQVSMYLNHWLAWSCPQDMQRWHAEENHGGRMFTPSQIDVLSSVHLLSKNVVDTKLVQGVVCHCGRTLLRFWTLPYPKDTHISAELCSGFPSGIYHQQMWILPRKPRTYKKFNLSQFRPLRLQEIKCLNRGIWESALHLCFDIVSPGYD